MSSSLTNKFAEMAKQAGWPEDLIQEISVHINDGSVTLTYDAELQKKIHDLEYGHLSSPPTAVIRKFSKDATKSMSLEDVSKLLEHEGLI